MSQNRILNVAIVGGGPGCKAIMDMIFTKKLSQLRMRLVGVADRNTDAVGYRYAAEKGIFTTLSYFIAHESHHRGSVILTLKECGYNLEQSERYAIWDWDRM